MKSHLAPSRSITEFASSHVDMTMCTRSDAASVHYAVFAPGGLLGRHPARRSQSFTVVTGTGWVAGTDGIRQPVSAGQGVTWEPGEEHESGTDVGMCVVIVEEHA